MPQLETLIFSQTQMYEEYNKMQNFHRSVDTVQKEVIESSKKPNLL